MRRCWPPATEYTAGRGLQVAPGEVCNITNAVEVLLATLVCHRDVLPPPTGRGHRRQAQQYRRAAGILGVGWAFTSYRDGVITGKEEVPSYRPDERGVHAIKRAAGQLRATLLERRIYMRRCPVGSASDKYFVWRPGLERNSNLFIVRPAREPEDITYS
ncbi:hypothetical protein MYCTH_2130345 [Thermothelomyces thermophilus ATCC 42464]|uniref:Uncharacterized protein n=1 Tax=Thermothelomyces thermophilus (strain ATCC 42464 / BCRC 31852 / DSM 1799) TaxID=573729 RepID=G2QML3_THET4|nr:uncharacterized protein MYCTH_2130345 [Thermothelomyces thermophilus ATCC 42464]AEO61193.1 hypothetical protein MYCTH_2130345 [Thermothelomyces thermophilus ATCC 42464]